MGTLTQRTILVTGGTGFIGSHVVEQLLKQQCRVISTSIEHDPRSYFQTQQMNRHVQTIFADVTNYTRMASVIGSNDIDYIIHLAAQPLVETAYRYPRETYLTNIMGTVNILEAARHTPSIKGILIASSDKAYGKKKTDYTESDPLQGDHPYESSKSSADLIARTYAKTYHMPIVITRFGNVYGPGDLNTDRIVPGIMHAVLTNTELVIRSDGTYVRDYCYVRDIARATVELLEHTGTTSGEAFNISSDDTYSVIDLLKKTESVLKKKIAYRITNTAQNEIPRQSLSYERIRKTIGWKPTYTLKTGLIETFSWYRKYICLL